jgi:hypothetical protein
MQELVTLYRPIGLREMALVKDADWRAFPARSRGQPNLCPLPDRSDAAQIARDWKVKTGGAGFVTRFAVKAAYLRQLQAQAGEEIRLDYWIAREELPRFNENIVGKIEVIEAFYAAND